MVSAGCKAHRVDQEMSEAEGEDAARRLASEGAFRVPGAASDRVRGRKELGIFRGRKDQVFINRQFSQELFPNHKEKLDGNASASGLLSQARIVSLLQ